jgi:hypothetical protein
LLTAVCVLAGAIALASCGGGGGSGGEHPGDAIHAYLAAVADDKAQQACDLLTVEARAKVVEVGGSTDCPALVETFHQFLGGDAGRLKDAEVSNVSVNGDNASASVTLDDKTIRVELKQVEGDWRIDTFPFAGSLLGVG